MNVRKFTKSAWVRLPVLLIACLMLTGLLLAQAPAIAVSDGLVVTRTLPDTVEPGETFTVEVTFTAPEDDFNGIGLTDFAPDVPSDWLVTANAAWCTPAADYINPIDNKAEIAWLLLSYPAGTAFTGVYKVTVPGAATPGTYDFAGGQLEYYIGGGGPYIAAITGDDSVEIGPDISVDPTSKDFGDVYVGSSSSAQTFTVSNDGTADLVVGTINITGSGAGHFAIQNDNCSGQTIAPTDSATLQVVFSPTSSGTKTAQLSIPSNDSDENPLNVSLQGRGEAGACNNGSANVAFIPNPSGPGGGTLPTTDSAFDAFTFTNVPFASVSAATLASYDTVILISCDPLNDLNSSQRTDLINWISDGGKLIIYDSECVEDTGNPTNDFTWLPCGFESYGPGGWGATADADPWVTLEIVEDNTLSSSDSGSPYFIDTDMIAHDTDGAGDMNVFLTRESCWCGDMLGTNAIDEEGQRMSPGTTGYVHAYSHYGDGLMIYNGLDIDWMGSSTDPTLDTGTSYLAKIWLLELEQAWGDTCGLPCGARIQPLACDFEASPRTGLAPLDVQFTDLTTGTPDTWEWTWDFGDGATSTEQNPTHTYTAAGKYTVSLGVTTSWDESCTETKVAYITVRELPTEEEEPANLVAAYLLISPTQVAPNQQVEISINIGNDGGTAGTRSIALYINGVLEQSQTVSVSAGSAKTVVFTVTKSEPGTYQVMLEGNEGQFTVTGTAGGHWGGPLGTGGIIAIVVVVIALVLGLVFILRRE